jgi:ribonuclease-3
MGDSPYNKANKLITDVFLKKVLFSYGIRKEPGDWNNFRTAFVHKSYCTRKNENIIDGNILCPEGCLPLQEISHERLEFLGDSVLSTVVASYLYKRYKSQDEGFLTQMRTKLVNGSQLCNFAQILELGQWVLVSKQIEASGGRNNKNILEDTFEAFIGAIFTDYSNSLQHPGRGYKYAERWIITFLESHVDFSQLVISRNYKDDLFKMFMNNHKEKPFIEVVKQTTNKVTVSVRKSKNGQVIATGVGPNKKEAEQIASQNALGFFGIV